MAFKMKDIVIDRLYYSVRESEGELLYAMYNLARATSEIGTAVETEGIGTENSGAGIKTDIGLENGVFEMENSGMGSGTLTITKKKSE